MLHGSLLSDLPFVRSSSGVIVHCSPFPLGLVGVGREGTRDGWDHGCFLPSLLLALPTLISRSGDSGREVSRKASKVLISPDVPSQKPGPWCLSLALLLEYWGLCDCPHGCRLSQVIAGGRRNDTPGIHARWLARWPREVWAHTPSPSACPWPHPPCSSPGLLPPLTLPAPERPAPFRPACPFRHPTLPLPSAAFPRVGLDNLHNYPGCFLGRDSSTHPRPMRSDLCGWGLGSLCLTSSLVMLVQAEVEDHGAWPMMVSSSLSTCVPNPSLPCSATTSHCPHALHCLCSLPHLQGSAASVAQM